MNIREISTERRNPNTLTIDHASSLEIVQLMNKEDSRVPETIEKILPQIASAIDGITERMTLGGRLIYVGAGTSGRLGILDASECPPTFSTDPEDVQALIAGGEAAITSSFEGAEDDEEKGGADLQERGIRSQDVVVGIAASGRTPYTIGAMRAAKEKGALVIALVCSQESEMAGVADRALVAEVGAEVITGSTRLKAGTAQKLILNMLSTGTMIQQGKVYSNLMVDVQPTNEKLQMRSKHIIMEATGVVEEEAAEALVEYRAVKPAILSLLTPLKGDHVHVALAKHNGHIGKAIQAQQKTEK
ncbi:N-acetylmuramic acid 6-phosphate etherase [Halobacillus amylolyticus]|uniref:N-acetylmuramic acid 6-phosphate etherase n=1 Tax=Halobacillus amylolyticus TaxID=2932259 RepID=A0ABY4HB20_9BACI|nr:N-acetylmuramic acid 6-phosphate etherase [Halobacillus amylolyticus]UOR11622.1 N-acetylmuramic acid 6-phosphate etherase [Halobacillus amylolyticus]